MVLVAIFMKVGMVGFSVFFFFDHSYILVSNLLNIEHLNKSTDFINSYGVVLTWVCTSFFLLYHHHLHF